MNLLLPLVIDVSANGAVSIDSERSMVGMSRFSERAQTLAAALGTGVHTLHTDADVAALGDDAALALDAAVAQML